MIKHIVMWTIREDDSPGIKPGRLTEMKTRLLGLKEKISEIVSVEVFLNSPHAPKNNQDIILQAEFKSWADLETYQNHPSHREVADFIMNIRSTRASIDYEF